MSKTYDATTEYHQTASLLRKQWSEAQRVVTKCFAAGDHTGFNAACIKRDAILAAQRALRAAHKAS